MSATTTSALQIGEGQARLREILATQADVSSSHLTLQADGRSATCSSLPFMRFSADAGDPGARWEVAIDATPIRQWFESRFQKSTVLFDAVCGLFERFIGRFVLVDPQAWDAVRGRGQLLLANHEVGFESVLLAMAAAPLGGVFTIAVAKKEHGESWVAKLFGLHNACPGIVPRDFFMMIDRSQKEDLARIGMELQRRLAQGDCSALVHVEGTRSLSARTPVRKVSSLFIDLAANTGIPIVPVRFCRGLPVEELVTRLEFPVGYGKQDCYVGRPILPKELLAVPQAERKEYVLAAMNAIGPAHAEVVPYPPDPEFEARVRAWQTATGVPETQAVLGVTLQSLQDRNPVAAQLVRAAQTQELHISNDAFGHWLAEVARWICGAQIRILVDPPAAAHGE